MLTLTAKFLTDSEGNRIGALLDIEEYYQLLEALEELDEIHAFDMAKDANETPVAFPDTEFKVTDLIR